MTSRQFMNAIYRLTKDLATIQSNMFFIKGKESIFAVNNLLTDFYYKDNNNIQWHKHMVIRDNSAHKTTLMMFNNLELSSINIPGKTGYCRTNSGTSAFIVLTGSIEKYFINNNYEMFNEYKSGDVGNIFENETYYIKSIEDTMLLNISLFDDVEDCINSASEIEYKISNKTLLRRKYNNYYKMRRLHTMRGGNIDINDDGTHC
jgi:hypothetical protein